MNVDLEGECKNYSSTLSMLPLFKNWLLILSKVNVDFVKSQNLTSKSIVINYAWESPI